MSVLLRVLYDSGSDPGGGSHYYVTADGAPWRPTGYLFAGDLPPVEFKEYPPATSPGAPRFRLDRRRLIVSAFRMHRFGHTFVNRTPLVLDLSLIAPGGYRVVVVHNFHVEDRNPNLDECVAGIFLAGRRGNGEWEDPERYPVECRTIAVLGIIDTAPDAVKAGGTL